MRRKPRLRREGQLGPCVQAPEDRFQIRDYYDSLTTTSKDAVTPRNADLHSSR